ncbi:MAG: acyl-CoA dehydrogenase family protein [Roseibium sp.]
MKPFTAPLDDILFTLNHVAGASDLPDWDSGFAAEVAGHFAGFAEGVIAPLDETGDRQGCRLVDGRVIMPDGFADAYNALAEQGWQGLSAPEIFGGQGMSTLFQAMTSEIFVGANHSLQMVTTLAPGAVRTLLRFGSEGQKSKYIPQLASGAMLATMCLTEPEAGSDLARVRCKAERNGTDWTLSGEKIFISGGDQNLSEHILHLVLARTSDDGIKGLSLFLCPSQTDDGPRNSVSVTRIEEKMGLHASPTCQLVFDGARAELIGEEGKGLAAMFTMMNHARADVALQGVAHAARTHDIARTYAAERLQGRTADGRPARLDQHADVQRMLSDIDSLTMSARAIAQLAYVTMERGDAPDLVEFLTPVAKVYCTQAGIKAADLGMQVLGGYGYLKEYRLEQTFRDARITTIYEGANGIHARTLATRLLKSPAADAFEAFVTSEATHHTSRQIEQALETWQSARADLLAQADPTPKAHAFMELTTATLLECIWHRFAATANQHPDPERIKHLADRARLHESL